MFAYVKYVCLVDYAIMQQLGVSFARTGTMAHGAPRCDFRFARSGPLRAGWPPDDLPEFQA
jgi:hypothetical protein